MGRESVGPTPLRWSMADGSIVRWADSAEVVDGAIVRRADSVEVIDGERVFWTDSTEVVDDRWGDSPLGRLCG